MADTYYMGDIDCQQSFKAHLSFSRHKPLSFFQCNAAHVQMHIQWNSVGSKLS
ncbi:hypothetical protein DM01DRAFT_1335362 [Hesseltinella vesiculosa]|uniref:Uncharacterized protein n=1 Tax=Hesseltinella vesiculosa TaxID=101127 RepID=A0A1X2GJ97_9FUNG|nr:hypothetical protein DM01DRAFT_1335362 [Hesseltinella vesiculosa]